MARRLRGRRWFWQRGLEVLVGGVLGGEETDEEGNESGENGLAV